MRRRLTVEFQGEGTLEEQEQIGNCWVIEIDGRGVRLTRYVHGSSVPNESYRIVEKEEGAVYIAAVINGYQPPRSLLRQDRPTG